MLYRVAQKVCESRGSHVYHRLLRNICATLYNVVHLGAVITQYDVVSRHLLGEVKVRVKIKVALEQATKAQKGSICIALLFLKPRR